MMPSGVKVYLASQPVDFRKGPDSPAVPGGATRAVIRSAARFTCSDRGLEDLSQQIAVAQLAIGDSVRRSR